jgi:hypothetical protein
VWRATLQIGLTEYADGEWVGRDGRPKGLTEMLRGLAKFYPDKAPSSLWDARDSYLKSTTICAIVNLP